MLPSFPKAQKILNAAYNSLILAARATVVPPHMHPRVRPLMEGKRSDCQREDRTIKELKPKLHKVEVTADATGKGMTREVFETMARELGEGAGREMWKHMLESIDEAVSETGNTLAIKHGEFTKDDFLR